ncbi:MAG: YdcF family protein [Oscillospiraceae bacterium]|nr:YdcF family protein [Oscillospiraceae bacterium]
MLKLLFLILGAAVTLDGIFMWLTSNFTMGNVMNLALGAALLAFGLLHHLLSKGLRLIVITAFLLVALAVALLTLYGTADTVTYEEDAVIVLGAAVRGKIPSGALQDRLDAALRYHGKNPDAVIVVSGGQGAQEDITEALAMERYLTARGVPKEKILKEERATSTLENFRFSKALLDAELGESYTACFITNEYHVYRAGRYAEQVGFEPLTHAHSNTRWYGLLAGVLRECLAVAKYHLIDA